MKVLGERKMEMQIEPTSPEQFSVQYQYPPIRRRCVSLILLAKASNLVEVPSPYLGSRDFLPAKMKRMLNLKKTALR